MVPLTLQKDRISPMSLDDGLLPKPQDNEDEADLRDPVNDLVGHVGAKSVDHPSPQPGGKGVPKEPGDNFADRGQNWQVVDISENVRTEINSAVDKV